MHISYQQLNIQKGSRHGKVGRTLCSLVCLGTWHTLNEASCHVEISGLLTPRFLHKQKSFLSLFHMSKWRLQVKQNSILWFLCPLGWSGNPLRCSCLENPRDSGAWWAAVYGVAQSRTRLKRLSSSSIKCYKGNQTSKMTDRQWQENVGYNSSRIAGKASLNSKKEVAEERFGKRRLQTEFPGMTCRMMLNPLKKNFLCPNQEVETS